MRHTALLAASGLLAVVVASCGGSVPMPVSGLSTDSHDTLSSAQSSGILHYHAVPLPTGFVPLDIMKDGQVPGSISTHAAIYKNGHLTILPDFPECTPRGPNPQEYITAASVNSRGEAVGFCDLSNQNTLFAGIPLSYKDGLVTHLVSSEQGNSVIECMAINDLGVIVGAINPRGNSGSALLQFYSDGRHATYIAPGGNGNCWIDDNDLIATTEYNPGDAVNAEYVKLSGAFKFIFPYPTPSDASWMNESGAVVGSEGRYDRPFIVVGGKASFVPGQNVNLTGINVQNEVIGQDTLGIFIYANGEKTNISRDIFPARDYTVVGQVGFLGGLSDRGEFVAGTSAGKYYFISPDR